LNKVEEERRAQAATDRWVEANLSKPGRNGCPFWGDPSWDAFKEKSNPRGHRTTNHHVRLP
jgi:hypothetical protein